MMIALGHRVGQPFYHRDTRLSMGHPAITHSVDASVAFSTDAQQRWVRLEYGLGGDGQLWVEVTLANPSPSIFRTYACFSIAWLRQAKNLQHESLVDLARKLGRNPREVAKALMTHAPRMKPKGRRPKGPPPLKAIN